jgi:RNA polymerase sigma factor (sigma-70 family)
MGQALENLADEELARRACAGSAACYEEIVRRYQAPLMRFLTKRFPSRRDAEDILQDAFVRGWQALHRYDSRYPFRTWIYTIAYRLAVSRGRRETVTEEALPEQSAAGGARPEVLVEREESRETLWQKARAVLSEEQYMALWLFYVDDVPAGEVARILNRSWVSVKTLMHRARRKLAPYLAELAPGGAEVPAAVTVKAGDP